MDRRRELLREVGPPLLLALITTVGLVRLRDGAPEPGELVVSVLLWLPALARRRAPVLAFAATALLVAAHWVPAGLDADDLVPADLALWVTLAALTERRSLRTAIAATAVCEVLVLASLFGDPLSAAPADEGHPVGLFTAMTVAAALFGRNRRTRQALLTQLRDRAEQAERERDQQARIAVAEERTRIAREVHDVVSHNISVMTALADGAGFALASDAGRPQAREAVAAIADTGRSAIAEMHRLLGVFRAEGDASRTPAPGLADLPALVEQVRVAGLPTTLTVTGRPAPLGTTAQLAVYRLVQEALTNTRKHAADARHAEVMLVWDDEGLHVRVQDDGTPTAPPGDHRGQGLVGMRERIGAHGGTVHAGRGEDGWLVEASLPVPATVGAP
ncbi:two-component sensor histidine kinase [Modestobacter muralis]|uniref:histidine kinase n=1 Tax=Modestobacter muralis TaxID=1608614 RepID=A0A6P0EMD3_9ACTN|nr:two-component sensor histidine kinase [Modestobacter muralis]NEN49449.1 two-component sensor histidine kinase [Modestobacter muralis]